MTAATTNPYILDAIARAEAGGFTYSYFNCATCGIEVVETPAPATTPEKPECFECASPCNCAFCLYKVGVACQFDRITDEDDYDAIDESECD